GSGGVVVSRLGSGGSGGYGDSGGAWRGGSAKQTPFLGWGGGCRVEVVALAAGETSGGGGVAWPLCGVAVVMVLLK
nr:hypothetical protein [Tanacetum cinerariifolium]